MIISNSDRQQLTGTLEVKLKDRSIKNSFDFSIDFFSLFQNLELRAVEHYIFKQVVNL